MICKRCGIEVSSILSMKINETTTQIVSLCVDCAEKLKLLEDLANEFHQIDASQFVEKLRREKAGRAARYECPYPQAIFVSLLWLFLACFLASDLEPSTKQLPDEVICKCEN